MTDRAGRYPAKDGAARHVAIDETVGRDDARFANRHAARDNALAADIAAVANDDGADIAQDIETGSRAPRPHARNSSASIDNFGGNFHDQNQLRPVDNFPNAGADEITSPIVI